MHVVPSALMRSSFVLLDSLGRIIAVAPGPFFVRDAHTDTAARVRMEVLMLVTCGRIRVIAERSLPLGLAKTRSCVYHGQVGARVEGTQI